MKTVALLPVKNEAWILSLYLESISPIADLIIALDDNSDDNTAAILKQHPKVELYSLTDLENELNLQVNARDMSDNAGGKHGADTDKNQKLIDMSARRRFLLKKAREAKATHQIWLDADEIIPIHFHAKLRSALQEMRPGQKMILPWITLWKNSATHRVDRVWKNLSKDFIFCEDGISLFAEQKLSEGRTPSNALYGNGAIHVDVPVAHYQFVFFKRAMIKQAWYRCHELLQGARSARRINATYSIAEDDSDGGINGERHSRIETASILPAWELKNPQGHEMQDFKIQDSSYFKNILNWFDEKGAEFFEGLNIWDIKELRDAFIERTGREPKPQVFPPYIIKLNEFRHLIFSRIASISRNKKGRI